MPSITANYIYNLFYQLLTLITPFVTTPYVSRIFGADGTGTQSYTNSIVSYFTILAALGTASYGQREIARNRNDEKKRSIIFWEIEILCIISTVICLILWGILIALSKEYTPYFIVLTMTLIAVAFDVSWFFSGLEEYKLISMRNMGVKILGIIALFTFVKEKKDLLLYVALLSATGLLGNLSMWSYLRKYIVKVPLRELNVLRHVKQTFVYFIPTLATSAYTMLDKAMLGLFTTVKNENGYYEYATGFVNMAKILIVSFNAVMSSRMSFLFAEKKYDEIRQRTEDSLRITMLMGFPIMFGLIGIASGFIPWFLGDGYDKVVPLLYAMSPLVIIVGFSDFMGSQLLTPSGQRGRSSKAIIAGSLLNFVLNIILIPKYKSVGAAGASMIAEILITGAYFYMCKGYFNIKEVWNYGYKYVIASIIMLMVVIKIGNLFMVSAATTVIQIAAGAAVYLLCIVLLRDKMVLKVLERRSF